MLDFGEVILPDWKLELSSQQAVPFREVAAQHGVRAAYLLLDINYIRTWVRKRRYGESGDPGMYRVVPTWPNGDTAEWIFDHTVGWPTEGGEVRDWQADWEQNFGGVA